jgi:hypothetical protein
VEVGVEYFCVTKFSLKTKIFYDFIFPQPTLQAVKLEIVSKGREARDEKFEKMDELESKEELLKEAQVECTCFSQGPSIPLCTIIFRIRARWINLPRN